jgi:hypothetical protein
MRNQDIKSHLRKELARVIQQIKYEVHSEHTLSADYALASLDLTIEKLRHYPDDAKVPVLELFAKLKQVILGFASANGDGTNRIHQDLYALQNQMQEYGISISQLLEVELSEQIQQLLSSAEMQQQVTELSRKLQELAKQPNQDPDVLQRQISDTIIQPLAQKLLVDEDEKFWEQKRQSYKQSARDAIAKSFKSLNLPSFAGGDLNSNGDQKGIVD